MITSQYLAGFIDGEGYLGIMKHRNKTKRGYSYISCIKIAQKASNAEILTIIHNMFGGHLDKPRTHKGNQNDSVMIAFRGTKSITNILKSIYPYLIVKRKQAEILNKFIQIKTPSTRIPILVDEVMEEMYKKKEALYLEIKKLNKRGKE